MSEPKITISGLTFSADQVKNAVITIDGKDITIHNKKEESEVGFKTPKQEKTDE